MNRGVAFPSASPISPRLRRPAGYRPCQGPSPSGLIDRRYSRRRSWQRRAFRIPDGSRSQVETNWIYYLVDSMMLNLISGKRTGRPNPMILIGLGPKMAEEFVRPVNDTTPSPVKAALREGTNPSEPKRVKRFGMIELTPNWLKANPRGLSLAVSADYRQKVAVFRKTIADEASPVYERRTYPAASPGLGRTRTPQGVGARGMTYSDFGCRRPEASPQRELP